MGVPSQAGVGRGGVLAIVNGAAAGGRGGAKWLVARGLLERAGVGLTTVFSEGPGDALRVAAERGREFGLVLAAGGDGTVGEVAGGLIQAGEGAAALGVMPLGTGNDVARMVGVEDLRVAVEVVRSGEVRAMDAIQVRCRGEGKEGTEVLRHALLFASVGFAGALLKRTTPRIKRWLGARASYSVGLFRALPGFRAPRLEIEWDEERLSGRWLLACAANAEVAGGGMMRVGPGARVDDGLLNISLIEDLSWLEICRCFPLLRRGGHVRHPKVRYGVGRRLGLVAEPAMDVQMDGDVFGRTPVVFSVAPRALRVWGRTGWGANPGLTGGGGVAFTGRRIEHQD